MSRPVKITLWALLGIALLAIASVAGFLIMVRTAWFKDQVRQRIVAVAEQATGGRVEIGSFNYDWHALTADVAPFVLHGTEPSSSPPLFRAGRIRIGLRIISAFKKQVDIALLQVDHPQVHVSVAADGSTNIPPPQKRRSGNFAGQLLDLKVRHFVLKDGFAEYNSQRIPLDAEGDHLDASLVYDESGPSYRGGVSWRQVRVSAPQFKQPLVFGFAGQMALESNAVRILKAAFTSAGAKVEAQGSIENLPAPHATLDLKASTPVTELQKLFQIPLEPRGEVSFQGQGHFESSPFQYNLEGKIAARGLGYRFNDVAVRDIAVASKLELSPAKLRLTNLDLSALNGHFRGAAELSDFHKLAITGEAHGFALRDLAALGKRNAGELSGILNGPIRLNGELARGTLRGVKAQAQLTIAPGSNGTPIEGVVTIAYDQAAAKLELGTSELTLGTTHATVSGVLGLRVAVHLVSQNLADALPLFPLLGATPPNELPLSLDGSSATFDGTVSGPLDDPKISGKTEIGPFTAQGHHFDRLTATLDLDQSSANFRTLTLAQGKMHVEGQGRVSLHNWKAEESSAISGLVSVTGADIQSVADEAKIPTPVTGTISGILHVSGSIESPVANGTIEAANVSAYGEHADSVRGDVTVSTTAIEVSGGDIRSGAARITLGGAYNHLAKDWKDGSLRFDVSSARLTLAQIKHVQDFRPGLGGNVDLKANGTAKVVKGVVDLTALTAQAALHNATLDGQPYGDLEMTASTRLPILGVNAKVNLGGIQIEGSGEWRMEGDYTGEARFVIPQIPFQTLHDLTPGPHARTDLPFNGFLRGEATVTGPLNNLPALKTEIVLSNVEFRANPGAAPKAGASTPDLVLSNSEPVRLDATTKAIDIRSASFTARDTSLNATGRLTFDTKSPWDLNVAGRINLSILQIFNPNLLAAGASIVNLSVRGPLMEPQIDGRLALQNASLFLRDFPTGVDQANGLILFDRNRATVQSLTALAGGGNVKFEPGSFVGFRGPTLLYRVQATADNVRYRTPEGVSITVDSNVALVGTSENSVLSGSVRVVRAAFNPRTDVGALLASTQKPVSAPSEPSEYLRGVQFDVLIESARSLEVETSLTRNIEATANLRLRGTPDRPVLIGTISVNAGQIEFFGNKYTINRGDIRFYNPLRIEPVLDMDLETQVRGITVDVSFSGSLNKLNFSYRSDPPLQANDIVALLAVGRAPSAAGPLAAAQATDTSYLGGAGGALLGQAIQPATGRLQKIFGVSHIKIDPEITDITTLPQARLTFEQQVSSAVTLTYITNLAVANQQIVRLEWDLNKRWSVVALRDENGAFSIDFQYKRSFK